MISILPAILPETFSELEEKLALVANSGKTVHLDVCDGMFVPNACWPYNQDDSHFEAIKSEKEGMPYWERVDFEVHLMVENPEAIASDWVLAGATRVIAHVEAVTDFSKLKESVGELTELGLSLKYETALADVEKYKEEISTLHVMTISEIGYQGSSFEGEAIERVKEARQKFPHVAISVDGGVTLENAGALIDAGADRLIVGSALFGSEDISNTLRQFEGIIKSNDSHSG